MDDEKLDEPIKRRCVGTVKATGEQCRKSAIKGTTVCRSHGGAAPQVRRKAAQNVADEKVREAARRWVRPEEARQVTPRQGMMEEWARVTVVVDFLDELVSSLEYDAVGAPELPGPGNKLGAEYLRAYVQWRDQEITRKIKLGEVLEKLGLSERELALAEEHARQLGAAMAQALTAEGVPAETAVKVLRRLGPLMAGGQ